MVFKSSVTAKTFALLRLLPISTMIKSQAQRQYPSNQSNHQPPKKTYSIYWIIKLHHTNSALYKVYVNTTNLGKTGAICSGSSNDKPFEMF